MTYYKSCNGGSNITLSGFIEGVVIQKGYIIKSKSEKKKKSGPKGFETGGGGGLQRCRNRRGC